MPAKKKESTKKSAAAAKSAPAKSAAKKAASKAAAPKKTAPKQAAPKKPKPASVQVRAAGDVLVASAAAKSIMFDCYSNLLSDRQRDIFTWYYEDNLSLSEIAAELAISRQAVHETLKKAEGSLVEAEAKLGLVEKHETYLAIFASVEQGASKLIEDISGLGLDKKDADRLKRQLRKITKSVSELDV
ncbi:MAG: HTH domain-containing protein [Clostridiales Family XIII bacterium]|jgi:predicted DNA-binding protein YlxM (UPF0122 family)|nr:HTH domain-containing protein [Clostridiales Family XIII bacterium]